MNSASDLRSLIVVVDAHEELEDCHWFASMRVAFSAWKEILLDPAGVCHSL